jgi:DNA polymerase III delta prime subunit
MKYYESTCNEYIQASKQFDLHPELAGLQKLMPASLSQLGNMILYGPPGAGKYTQFLRLIEAYSENKLKTEKMKVQTEKQEYEYHISDVHYEIDLALLGCESKKIWNDAFFQIVDIVSAKKSKSGIILCKNFNAIHSELLDVFYSYIQQFSKSVTTHFGTNITIFFILITENISFLPNNILNSCQIINVRRPTKQQYTEMLQNNMNPIYFDKTTAILDMVDCHEIINIKELYSFHKITHDIPTDMFNIICDNIIHQILNYKKIDFVNFRDIIYDILIYNLEVVEILWFILFYLVNHQTEHLSNEIVQNILKKSYTFLKYYNNNYRPIYHLESMLFYIIIQIYKIE